MSGVGDGQAPCLLGNPWLGLILGLWGWPLVLHGPKGCGCSGLCQPPGQAEVLQRDRGCWLVLVSALAARCRLSGLCPQAVEGLTDLLLLPGEVQLPRQLQPELHAQGGGARAPGVRPSPVPVSGSCPSSILLSPKPFLRLVADGGDDPDCGGVRPQHLQPLRPVCWRCPWEHEVRAAAAVEPSPWALVCSVRAPCLQGRGGACRDLLAGPPLPWGAPGCSPAPHCSRAFSLTPCLVCLQVRGRLPHHPRPGKLLHPDAAEVLLAAGEPGAVTWGCDTGL